MLRCFRLCNFRSYKAEQALQLAAVRNEDHASTVAVGEKGILKTLVVFGANSAGKSGVVAAMKMLKEMVLSSHAFSSSALQPLYTPFRHLGSTCEPTHFGVDLTAEGIRYKYDVEYDAKRIRWERLLVYKTGKAQRWFERSIAPTGDRTEWAPFSSSLHGSREMWRRATSPSSLFLSTAVALNCQQMRPLYDWFSSLFVIDSASSFRESESVAAAVGTHRGREALCSLLRALDLSVTDIRVVEPHSPHSKDHLSPTPRADLRTCEFELFHSTGTGAGTWIPANLESAGTRDLVAFISVLLNVWCRGGLLVVDDFGRRWHPLVARALLQALPSLGGATSQLIVTSHEVALMDVETIGRDQIWLVEQNSELASCLMPVLRRGVRPQRQIARQYMAGRLGAIPKIER